MVLPAASSTGSERPSDRIQQWRAKVFRLTGANDRPLAFPLGQPRGHAHAPLWTCYGIDIGYGQRVRLFFQWARWRFQDRNWEQFPNTELIRFVQTLLDLGLNDLPEAHNDMVRNTNSKDEVRPCELHGRPPSTIGVSGTTDSTIYIPPLNPNENAAPADGPPQAPATAGSAPAPPADEQSSGNVRNADPDEAEEVDELEEDAVEGGAADGNEPGHMSGGGDNDMGHGFVADNDDDIDSVDSASTRTSARHGGGEEGLGDDDESDAGGTDGAGNPCSAPDAGGAGNAGNARNAGIAGHAGGAANVGGVSSAPNAHSAGGGCHDGDAGGAQAAGDEKEMVARSTVGDGAPAEANAAGDAQVSSVAETVHRFSPNLAASTPSSSVIWIPNPQSQAGPPAHEPATRSCGLEQSRSVKTSASAAPQATCVSGEDELPHAPLAGPSRHAAPAAGLSSAFGFRLPPPDVTSSPPPFRSIPSATSLTRLGVTTYFGQPASFSQPPSASDRPQTPLRDTQPATGPPPRKRAKRPKVAPLKQYVYKPRKPRRDHP